MSLPGNLSATINLDHLSLPVGVNLRLHKKQVLFFLELSLLCLLGLALTVSVQAGVNNTLVQPKIINTVPFANFSEQDISSPIYINFDHPVAAKDIKATIEPKAAGSWSLKKGFWGDKFSNQYIFTPKVTLNPNSTYKVFVSNIHSNAGFDQPYDHSFTFKTADLPKIVKSLPKNQASNISPTQILTFDLDHSNNFSANFSFTFNPPFKYNLILSSNKLSYQIKPLEALKQSTTYEVFIEKTPLSYDLEKKRILEEKAKQLDQKIVFTTIAAPTIASVSASGDSASPGPITITFTKDMNRASVESKFSTTTLTDYSFSWTDNKTLIITPKKALAFNTNYAFVFGAGTLAADGSYFESDYEHRFTTLGNVKVGQFSPSNGATNASVGSKILVYFNQAVDHSSAQSKFSISPSVEGTFSWTGNTLVFNPINPLSYLQTYNLKIASGVKSLTALDSVSEFNSSFKTADLYESIRLSVPVYRQKYTLSCEFANMRMALAFKGVNKSEDELIAQTSFDNTPHTGDIWGDPYAGFVGNVAGTYFVDGYGAYYPVIDNVISKYRPAESHVGWNLTSLLTEIKAGNPVIVWACLICNKPRYWNTPLGKEIYAYEYYHMMTVVGYTGNPNNPQSIILNDSVSGKQLTYSKSQFLAKWSIMNYTATVVK